MTNYLLVGELVQIRFPITRLLKPREIHGTFYQSTWTTYHRCIFRSVSVSDLYLSVFSALPCVRYHIFHYLTYIIIKLIDNLPTLDKRLFTFTAIDLLVLTTYLYPLCRSIQIVAPWSIYLLIVMSWLDRTLLAHSSVRTQALDGSSHLADWLST